MTLAALSGVASRQVFLAGSIHDALSGRAPWTQPSILLRFQAAPQRPLALRLRHHLPTGLYAFYGDPRSALPVLAAPDTLDLELVVSAPRYATATVPISLTEADLQLVEPTREVEGQTVALARRPALPLLLDVLLAPLPLVLVGRVVRADDPSVAVVGASIAVTAPSPAGPVVSNALGAYTLPDLPVAEEITLQVTAAGFSTLTLTRRLDYRRPVNEQHFHLTT